MSQELKIAACRFCGGRDLEKISNHDTFTGKDSNLIYCRTCAACAPPSTWNRRAETPEVRALVEAVKAFCEPALLAAIFGTKLPNRKEFGALVDALAAYRASREGKSHA